MKRCCYCHETKQRSDFNLSSTRPDGLQSGCRDCSNARRRAYYADHIDAQRAARTASYRANKATENRRERERRRVRQHGGAEATPGPCAICGVDGPRVIDHDHSCCPPKRSCDQCRRGLLCSRCNLALGLLGDDPERLAAAIDYLMGHGANRDARAAAEAILVLQRPAA